MRTPVALPNAPAGTVMVPVLPFPVAKVSVLPLRASGRVTPGLPVVEVFDEVPVLPGLPLVPVVPVDPVEPPPFAKRSPVQPATDRPTRIKNVARAIGLPGTARRPLGILAQVRLAL